MEQLKKIIKGTKQGKWAVAFAILALLSIVVGIAGSADIGSAASGFLVFLIISAVLLIIGKKRLDSPSVQPVPSSPTIERDAFTPTKKIGKYLHVDEVHKKWRVPCDKKNSAVYAFSDLLDFECIEDGNTISKGSVLNAAAGGLMFGTVGAIVGAGKKKTKATCTKLQVKISVNNLKMPIAYIDLLDFEIKKESDIYKAALKSAEEITAVLLIIKNGQQGEE